MSNLRKVRRELSHRIHATRSQEIKLINGWLKLASGDRVCDVGCGDGYWTGQLAKRIKNVTAFGIDPDGVSILRAQHYYGHLATFSRADGEHLPFHNGSFNKLISVCALEHFQDDQRALREFHRVLQKGGLFVTSVDTLNLKCIPEEYKLIHADKFAVNNFYNVPELEKLLIKSGFKLLNYQYLATSRLSSIFIRAQVRLGFNVNYFAPLSLPLSKVSDILWGDGKTGGHILVIAAKRL